MKNRTLFQLAEAVYKKEDITYLYKEQIKNIEIISPDEVFLAMSELLKQGKTAEEVLPIVDKVINVIYKPLSEYYWDKPSEGTFIYYLIQENNSLRTILEQFKSLVKNQEISYIKKEGINLIRSFKEYSAHLLKLENILFPALELKQEMFNGLSIMWALHGETESLLKQAESRLLDSEIDLPDVNKIIGKLYFKYFGLIQKQELLLFPSAMKWLNEDEMEKMHAESFDFGFTFMEEPERPLLKSIIDDYIADNEFESRTGTLNFKQLYAVFNSLPFDITIIDEKDKVAYFSDNNDRIFPRTPSVIGRKVQNCHPPKSLEIVEKILRSFKDGKKDTETFWINTNGKTILIKYTALRDESGKYLGTMEVTQDITEIKSIKGEKKLIDDRK